jgi:uncharacterized membrane protein YfcA
VRDRDLAGRVVSVPTIVLALLLGLSAGVLAGMFGVGGGILFVPTLVALGLGQLEAQGTSLLAILPTVLVGAWSQRRYGNLRVRTAVVVGVSSVVGVEVGARLVTALPETTLRRLFGTLLFAVAAQLVFRTRRKAARYPDSP